MKRNAILLMTIILFGIVSEESIAEIQPPTLSYATDGVNLTASWTSIPEATGYKLYYAPYPYTGENSVGSIDVGDDTAFIYPLWEGAAYYLAVEAYNSQETSGYSNIENFTIPYFGAPNAPQLSYNLAGTNIFISWGQVPGATGYILSYTTSVYTGPESFMANDLGDNTSFSYAPLSEGATYTIALQAYNEFGASDYSNVETFTVPIMQSLGMVGRWIVSLTTGSNNCGDPTGIVSVESNFIVEDTGMFNAFGTMLNGELSGDTLSWSGSFSFSEDGGTTTKTGITLTASPDGNSFEGGDDWSWTDGAFNCSGSDSLSGTRIN